MPRLGLGRGLDVKSGDFVPLFGTVTRNFTTSTSGGSEYWPLDSSVSLTGAFSITDDVATTSTAAGVLYSGGTAAGKLEVSLTAAGLVQVDVTGVTIFTGVIAVNDGKLNTLVLSRTGTTASLTVNGVADGSGTMSGTVAFDTLDARTAGSVFFIGTHANIVVIDAGTEIHSWPIDETLEDNLVLHDTKTVLGAEEVTNGTNITTTTGWVETRGASTLSAAGGNIVATSDSTASFGAVTELTGLTIGETYLLTYSLVAASTGTSYFRLSVNSDLTGPSIDRVTTIDVEDTVTFVATATTLYVGSLNAGHLAAGSVIELGNVSVKEADGYGTAVNFTSADSEPFTFDGSVSPNTSTNVGATRVLEVAGT